MSEIVATSGHDAWVDSVHPNRNRSGGDTIRLQSGTWLGEIQIPITGVRGRTVLSATVTGRVRDGFTSQTLTAKPITSKWKAGEVTWASKPSVGTGITTAAAAHSDGDAVAFDVTAIVQAHAAGGAYRGIQLSTAASTAGDSDWYSFDSGQPAWTLTIELSDAPEQPSDLRPDGGAVASGAPILAWSYTDLGGDTSEQGAFKVQADPAGDWTSPAFDTGWVTWSDPQCNLATIGGFTPLASGASTQWRVRTQDAGGNPSIWSDAASFSNVANPTLVMDSPTGGVIGDSTPDILAHLVGETVTQWRARVFGHDGALRWSSGLRDGPTIAITVPKRNGDNHRVIWRDDQSYDVEVRAFGDVDRATTVGIPAYVEQRVTVVFDDDIGVVAPSLFTVGALTPGDPRTLFSWFRDSAADGWLLIADGEIVHRLDADEVTVDAGTYSWADGGLAQPYQPHSWTVRAIESGHRSHPSNAVGYASKPIGVWLIWPGADPVVCKGRVSVDSFLTNDKRVSYKPLNSDSDIDVVYGFEGVSGRFEGVISTAQPNQPVMAAASRLDDLRADPTINPQMVWASKSMPILIRNLTALPSSEFTDANRRHGVKYDFIQAGD